MDGENGARIFFSKMQVTHSKKKESCQSCSGHVYSHVGSLRIRSKKIKKLWPGHIVLPRADNFLKGGGGKVVIIHQDVLF